MLPSSYVIELNKITKQFGKSTIGVYDVSLSIKRGEVVALVGEPGSGTNTISKILSGYISPDSGKIIINGKNYSELMPNQAIRKGIVTASYEYSLCMNMNILENLLLIAYKKNSRFNIINYSSLRKEAEELLSKLGSSFNLDVPLRELDLQDIPVIEIVKALLSKAELYVFDEVTKQIREENFINLSKIIKEVKKTGISFIYVPSTFAEVFEVADRIVVLRNGRIATILSVDETNIDELPELTFSSERALVPVVKNKFTNLENTSESMKEFISTSINIFSRVISMNDMAIVWSDKELIRCNYSEKLFDDSLIAIISESSKDIMKFLLEGKYDDIRKLLDEKISHLSKKYKLLPIAYETEIVGVVIIFQNSLERYYLYKRLFYSMFDFLTKSIQEFIRKELVKREERELETAGQIQKSLTTPNFASFLRLDVYGYSKPAKIVGGDYFDMFKIDDEKYVGIMADVSGKGIPAALIMVMIRSILKNTINSNASASQLMTILNNTLMGEIPEDRYVTTFLFIVDTRSKIIDYCNGGHHPMILFRRSNEKTEVYLLDSEGVPVGVIPNFSYSNKKTMIKNNDLFITYTDGITEAMNKDREEFGKQRLMRIINKYSHLESKKLSQIINRAIAKFSEGKQHDDETLLIFKLKD